MILWTKRFETGSAAIDQQHRMLIFNINHLESQLAGSNPTRAECEFLVHLVDFLEAYADAHFKNEEQCMECNRCAAHEQNQRAHENYRVIFSDYKARSEKEGFTLDLMRELHQAASLWIREHILQVDTRLRGSLRAAGASR